MKNLYHNLLKLGLVWAITVFLVASCTKPSYANSVHPHGELALVGYTYTSAYSPLRTFFMRKISMLSHVMVKLERDTSSVQVSCVACRPTLFSFATLIWS